MSEEKAVRGSDQVLRELVQANKDIEHARKVLIVGAGSIPRLVRELNEGLSEMGYVCVPTEPATGLYKSFADLLACPVLSALHDVEPEPVKPACEVAIVSHACEAVPFGAYLPADVGQDDPAPSPPEDPPAVAEPVPVPVQAVAPKPDMSKPVNWLPGDIFTENPRFTLAHLRRRWVLESFDEVDVEIGSPHTSSSELMTVELFMSRFVFVERSATEQSAA